MEQRHGPIDRTGSGKFVEVYPRAARDRWGITSPGALAAATKNRLILPDALAARCRQSEHCFDALVAALAARAAAIGYCDSVPECDLEAATVEGWIALPQRESLARLWFAR